MLFRCLKAKGAHTFPFSAPHVTIPSYLSLGHEDQVW